MTTIEGSSMGWRQRFWYLLPALVVVLLIFPLGMSSNVSPYGADNAPYEFKTVEMDCPGPGMQLNDISEAFCRSQPRRPFPIFHSMVVSAAYVPYLWARGGDLPPYDLKTLTREHPSLMEELIVVARGINLLAAIALVALAFHTVLTLSKSLPAASVAALSVAFNANLMFQSSVIYFENWSLLWAFLAAVSFVKLWSGGRSQAGWLSVLLVCAAFSVSTHERMVGYFALSVPLALCRVWNLNAGDPRRLARTIRVVAISLAVGLFAFCLANNVFGAGWKPIYDYIHFKSSAVAASGARSTPLGFLRNQITCHGHAALITFSTLVITPMIAIFGVWKLLKERFHPALALLAFPLGYQIVSIGLPGWTAGRYVLGQMIFVSIYAGLGIAWLLGWRPGSVSGDSGPACWILRLKSLVVVALCAQAAVVISVKVLDLRYNPHRVIESVVKENRGKRIGIQGFEALPPGWAERYGATAVVVPAGQRRCDTVDILVTNPAAGSCQGDDVERVTVRRPPPWMLSLISRERAQLYLEEKPSAISIQLLRRKGRAI